MPRQLKVFAAQLGFYDTVVAVPSQAAALKAWGTRMNLFADGVARPADDPQAIEAALASPGVPLKRGIGTGEPFSLTPSLPKLPNLPPQEGQARQAKGKARRRPAPKVAAPPPPPDRSALDAAETRLAEVEERWRGREAELQEQRQALDAEEAQARSDYEKMRRRAEAEQARARMTYEHGVAQAAERAQR